MESETYIISATNLVNKGFKQNKIENNKIENLFILRYLVYVKTDMQINFFSKRQFELILD